MNSMDDVISDARLECLAFNGFVMSQINSICARKEIVFKLHLRKIARTLLNTGQKVELAI